jgi:predicted metal-dependent HD superfamily phosphohydrolase
MLDRNRWESLLLRLDAENVPAGLFDELAAAYGEAHRAYHNQDHILDCLAIFHGPVKVF